MSHAPKTLLWLQAGSCGGCTMSVLEQGASGWFAELKNIGVLLLWHPSVSEESGAEVLAILDRIERGETRLDIFCVEGSILRGPNGSGKFNRLSGTNRSLLDITRSLAARADFCVAVGTCAAFGGVPAGEPDPTEACGLQYRRRRNRRRSGTRLSFEKGPAGDQCRGLRAPSRLDHGNDSGADDRRSFRETISTHSGGRPFSPPISLIMAARATNSMSSRPARGFFPNAAA